MQHKKQHKLNKKETTFLWLLAMMILVLLISYMLQKTHAQMDDAWKYSKEHKYPTATPTPQCTPTPIPTTYPINTPSPTVSYPPTSTSTNNAGSSANIPNQNTLPGSTTNAPASETCNIPFSPPVLVNIRAEDQPGQVVFSWLDSDTHNTKFSLIYGYNPNKLIYGVDNIPSTSTSLIVGGLIPGKNIFGIVQGWEGQCEESSDVIDPIIP